MSDDDRNQELSIDNPYFLSHLFQTDIIAAEIDWESERFLFYPVNTLSDDRFES